MGWEIDFRKFYRNLPSIIMCLAAILTIYNYLSGAFKVIWSFLTIKIDNFWLIMAIIALILIIINANKISPLGRKCANLLTLAKLPITLDKTITVEIDPKWHNPHRQRQIILRPHSDDRTPHIYFDMRVINRTYHSFEAENVVIKCFCGNEEVYKGTWDKSTRASETFDRVSDLSKFDDGEIEFHVPVAKIYINLEKWYLEGTVKYKSNEALIDTGEYAIPEIVIRLEYALSEEQITKLKEQVEKALAKEK